jgi:hypothetical protein
MRFPCALSLLACVLAWPVAATAQSVSLCAVSSDAEFGVTREKPIPTGGGIFNLSARERRYLSLLRGPAGQLVTVAPIVGSTLVPDLKMMLDTYQVSHEAGR